MKYPRSLLCTAVLLALAAGGPALAVPVVEDTQSQPDRPGAVIEEHEWLMAQDERNTGDIHKHVEKIVIDMPDINGIVDEAMSSAFMHTFSSGSVKSIKNAPYSGEVITEKIQRLGDGNQITHKNVSRVFRDAQGSTRQETLASNGDVKSVHIRDADGNRYVLNPAKHSAIKISLAEVHAQVGNFVSKHVKKIVTGKSGGDQVVVKQHDDDDDEGPGDHKEIRVQVMTDDEGEMGEHMAAFGDAFTHAWHMGEPLGISMGSASEKTTTKLGTKGFDGVNADGKSTSYTIPAGKIGNEKPIVVTSESWYAPELQITVYSKHSDPRSGDTIYRVANLKRQEPSPDLFKVPSDYTVKDLLASFKKRSKSDADKK
jgi:hypothetical protein